MIFAGCQNHEIKTAVKISLRKFVKCLNTFADGKLKLINRGLIHTAMQLEVYLQAMTFAKSSRQVHPVTGEIFS